MASNVYESLFEGEDESADARQVHAGLSAPLFLPAPLMRIIRLSFFIWPPDIYSRPFQRQRRADIIAETARIFNLF